MHPLKTLERPSSAIEAPASSPASADAGQGVGTIPEERNAMEWKSIAFFLDAFKAQRDGVSATPGAHTPVSGAAINFGGCAAPSTSIVPVGNTGTTYPRGEA